ncbi:hypothetical protein [Lentzea sp. E54]|uniref:hypothetical protein n=1 Tax=Lentzea xerophila TaxID=3435883 RepID=UPI003DA44B76
MSDDFLTDPGTNADGSQLRKFAEAQQRRAEELEQKLNKLIEDRNTETLTSAFDTHKIPAKLRDLYKGDPTAEAVGAWKEAYKDVFNFQPQGDTSTGAETTVSPEVRAQQEAAQSAAGFGQEPGQSQELDAFKAKAAAVRNTSAQRNPNALNELLAGMLPQGGYTPPQVI